MSDSINGPTGVASVAAYVNANKLKSVGAFWATGIVGSMAYQWSRNIPFQLKLIHSRIWAQGMTIGAICLSGLATQYDVYQKTNNAAPKKLVDSL
mmetsp:Transcript_1521/g.3389  ORF Transcript_1521/g.3389 Transcript_1521/m.3389 type:complete len:95 (-) Transcript_1521:116-400(-)